MKSTRKMRKNQHRPWLYDINLGRTNMPKKMIHANKLEVREEIIDPRDRSKKIPLLLITEKTETVILLKLEDVQKLTVLLECYINTSV